MFGHTKQISQALSVSLILCVLLFQGKDKIAKVKKMPQGQNLRFYTKDTNGEFQNEGGERYEFIHKLHAGRILGEDSGRGLGNGGRLGTCGGQGDIAWRR